MNPGETCGSKHGDVWQHRNGQILLHISAYPTKEHQKLVKELFGVDLSNYSGDRSWRTTPEEYSANGKHHSDTQWDLIKLIGNIMDPTKVSEDDWSDE